MSCYNRTLLHSKPIAGGDSGQVISANDERIKKKVHDSLEVMFIAADVIAVLATVMLVAYCCYNRKVLKLLPNNKEKYGGYNGQHENLYNDEEGRMVCFEGCKGFEKVEELLTSSAEMLGKGSVGSTYKVVVEGGDAVVVVKRVRLRERMWRRSSVKGREVEGFLRENIGGLRNPNVLSLRAFCCSKDELLLVYDYLVNGSLYSLLHG